MKNRFFMVILTAATVAASASCGAQVYSVGMGSDAFVPAPHRPDEIIVTSYSCDAGARSSRAEWYISTNALAKQPRWDGLSAEVPLSARKACALALLPVRKRFPEVQSWSVESIDMRNPYPDRGKAFPDVWCYEITLRPRDPVLRARFEFGPSAFGMTQIVLLDGTVVPPTILKKK